MGRKHEKNRSLFGCKWQGQQDSNPRHLDLESSALTVLSYTPTVHYSVIVVPYKAHFYQKIQKQFYK